MKRVKVRKRRYPSYYPWEVSCPDCSSRRRRYRAWGSAATTALQAIQLADRHARTHRKDQP